MLIHSRGATLFQDFSNVLGALRLGPDDNKPALVRKCTDVCINHFGRQTIIGKLRPECLARR